MKIRNSSENDITEITETMPEASEQKPIAACIPPDIFEKTMVRDNSQNPFITPFPIPNSSMGNGMASAGMSGSIEVPGGSEKPIIICPECGENTHQLKFCECCGAILH